MLTGTAFVYASHVTQVVLSRKQSHQWSPVLQRLRTVLSSVFEKLLAENFRWRQRRAGSCLQSLLDLFMTFLLLYFSNRGMMRNVVFESNPIAQYFISGWGTLGLIWFKLAMVTIIVLVAQVIATKRPVVARFVLNGATLFVGCVVVYSALLLIQNRI